MIEAIIIVCVVVVVIVVASIIMRVLGKRRTIARLRYSFGKSLQHIEYDIANIKKLQQECFPNDLFVDKITQDDLELEKIFRRINNTSSFLGEQFLWLDMVSLGKNKRFASVQKEFTEKCCEDESTRLDIQIPLERIGRFKNCHYFPFFMNNLRDFIIKKEWKYAIFLTILLSLIAAAIIFGGRVLIILAVVSYVVNIVVYAFEKNKFEDNLFMLEIVDDILTADTKIKKEIKKWNIETEYDTDIRKKIKKSLNRRLPFIRTKQAASMSGDVMALLGSYLLGAFMVDFLLYNGILKTIIANKAEIIQIAIETGEIDAMISTASYKCGLDICCEPEFTDEMKLSFEQIYHPLVEDAVCNDIEINGNCIITGSNASGKSTFIKALAINMILAQSIGICTAKKMKIPVMDVFTSMALRDNLTGGESFFVKEVKSLKRIIDHVEEGFSTLVVIDEILKGTNSEERIAASTAVLQYLESKNCIVIVASHDYKLLDLLDRDKYRCYYFCENPDEELALTFDYLIHEGFVKQTNAIKLLGYMNFPKEILEKAEALVGQS